MHIVTTDNEKDASRRTTATNMVANRIYCHHFRPTIYATSSLTLNRQVQIMHVRLFMHCDDAG
jgi:hypothetical protein